MVPTYHECNTTLSALMIYSGVHKVPTPFQEPLSYSSSLRNASLAISFCRAVERTRII